MCRSLGANRFRTLLTIISIRTVFTRSLPVSKAPCWPCRRAASAAARVGGGVVAPSSRPRRADDAAVPDRFGRAPPRSTPPAGTWRTGRPRWSRRRSLRRRHRVAARTWPPSRACAGGAMFPAYVRRRRRKRQF